MFGVIYAGIPQLVEIDLCARIIYVYQALNSALLNVKA